MIAAAAEGAMLSLVFFALLFGLAATRIAAEQRELVLGFFRAFANMMLVIVGWVLWVAPLGVFALALAMGARTGLGAIAALAHYIIFVSILCLVVGLLAYPVAALAGRVPIGRFARAAVGPQAVAVGTRSSLATLPSMIEAAETQLRLPVAVVGVTLPLAVSLFKVTGPIANVGIALYVASVYGVDPGPGLILLGAAVAVAASLGSVGVSNQVNFFVTIPPVCLAMGVPIELLAILVAVETIPDIFRTVGNVSMDLAVTSVVAERNSEETVAEGHA